MIRPNHYKNIVCRLPLLHYYLSAFLFLGKIAVNRATITEAYNHRCLSSEWNAITSQNSEGAIK